MVLSCFFKSDLLTEIDKNIKSNDEVIVITSQSQDKEVTDHAFTEMVPKNKEASMVEDIAGPDNLKKFNDILQDETPRKAPDEGGEGELVAISPLSRLLFSIPALGEAEGANTCPIKKRRW
jgi:hypothetical protein